MHSELNKTEETNLSIIMPDNINTTNQQQVFNVLQENLRKNIILLFLNISMVQVLQWLYAIDAINLNILFNFFHLLYFHDYKLNILEII